MRYRVLIIFIFVTEKSKCLVLEVGTNQTKECIFPFIYDGRIFEECTSLGEDSGDEDSGEKWWCSTHVDENGFHDGPDNWGYCPPYCAGI